jgi:very-short-patch-repair endonuclease
MTDGKQWVKITPAQTLHDALIKRGIKATREHDDGHKHVDIAVLDARLYIEVDGLQHFTKPEQIMRDFKRHHYSDGDDYDTFYVTNQILEKFLDDVVDALVNVIESRIKS